MYIGGDNVNYAYDEEQRVLITKDVLERARKDEGTIKDLAEKYYNISRKTFYNYRDYTRDILAKYGYEIRHIYDLSVDDLKAMVHGTYQRKNSAKETTEKPTEKNIEEITEIFTKKDTESGLIDDLHDDLKKTEEVKNDIDAGPQPKETVSEEKEEKKSNGWFKYAIYSVIALIAVIFVVFLSKPKEQKEETVNTQSSYKDEFEGFVMF